jgi:uncharacterized protein YndB with AHSA1/START domain
MSNERRIELDIEVPGTPEEVWRAVATGPGISSWYVPHVVEERQDGHASASFGDGPEMQISGRVAAWEPPHRVVFDNGESDGYAFEWLVEAKDSSTCIVRLINSGFGSGEEWDAQYDGMSQGWLLFLRNLHLHLTHFAGQTAQSMLPMAMWPGDRQLVWSRLCDLLGVPANPPVGTHIITSGIDVPVLSGTVVDASSWRIALLLDQPVPGTAFIAAEGSGESTGVSVWSYLYGPDSSDVIQRDKPRWQSWFDQHAAVDPTND